jgi:hypothetical protein
VVESPLACEVVQRLSGFGVLGTTAAPGGESGDEYFLAAFTRGHLGGLRASVVTRITWKAWR